MHNILLDYYAVSSGATMQFFKAAYGMIVFQNMLVGYSSKYAHMHLSIQPTAQAYRIRQYAHKYGNKSYILKNNIINATFAEPWFTFVQNSKLQCDQPPLDASIYQWSDSSLAVNTQGLQLLNLRVLVKLHFM